MRAKLRRNALVGQGPRTYRGVRPRNRGAARAALRTPAELPGDRHEAKPRVARPTRLSTPLASAAESRAVGAFGPVEIAEASTHEPERVPGARIPRIAPNGFTEPRFCQARVLPRPPRANLRFVGRPDRAAPAARPHRTARALLRSDARVRARDRARVRVAGLLAPSSRESALAWSSARPRSPIEPESRTASRRSTSACGSRSRCRSINASASLV